MDDVHRNDAPVWRIHVVVYAIGRNRMKSPYRKKKMVVAYKGWQLHQVPWSAYGKTQYAKWWINAQGKECIHSGYGNFVPRKKLRLMLKYHVDHLKEWDEMMQKIHDKKPLDIRMGETE